MKPGNKNEYPYTPARLVETSANLYVVYYVWSVREKQKVLKHLGF
ncbi:hypothetical protein GGR92_000470 [Spirosoma lacussanchae]